MWEVGFLSKLQRKNQMRVVVVVRVRVDHRASGVCFFVGMIPPTLLIYVCIWYLGSQPLVTGVSVSSTDHTGTL